MIAEVYPIKRMPRRFGVFDYALPEGMHVARGTMVRIPFRSAELVGVVSRVKERGSGRMPLKPIRGIIAETAFHDAELRCIEKIAEDTAQSISTLLYASVPKAVRFRVGVPRKRDELPLTVAAKEAPSIAHAAEQIGRRPAAFVSVPDLKRSTVLVAAYLREHREEAVSVILPNVRDARLVAGRLGEYAPLLVTGEESAGERYRAWTAWRARPAGLLVGTRGISLWTHHALGAVFLLRSGHPNHKQSDRNPRIDARAAATIVSESLRARHVRLDVSPGIEDLWSFGSANLFDPGFCPETTIVDMNVERPGTTVSFLGQTTVLRITETLSEGRRVLCVYNKKGVFRRLQCEDCRHHFSCGSCGTPLAVYQTVLRCHRCAHAEPLPLSCPTCRGKRLSRKGFGIRSVAAALQTLFPETTVGVLEKDAHVTGTTGSEDILVVTRHFLEETFDPFSPPSFGVVVELDADLPLYGTGDQAVENAIRSACEWRGLAHACRAAFLLQTETAELFRSGLSQPVPLLQEDLNVRRDYGRPPFTRRMTVEAPSLDPHKRTHVLQTLETRIRSIAATTVLEISEERIILTVPPEDIQSLLRFFSELDDDIIVDTRAVE